MNAERDEKADATRYEPMEEAFVDEAVDVAIGLARDKPDARLGARNPEPASD